MRLGGDTLGFGLGLGDDRGSLPLGFALPALVLGQQALRLVAQAPTSSSSALIRAARLSSASITFRWAPT